MTGSMRKEGRYIYVMVAEQYQLRFGPNDFTSQVRPFDNCRFPAFRHTVGSLFLFLLQFSLYLLVCLPFLSPAYLYKNKA